MPIAGLYGLGYATKLIDRARLKQLRAEAIAQNLPVSKRDSP